MTQLTVRGVILQFSKQIQGRRKIPRIAAKARLCVQNAFLIRPDPEALIIKEENGLCVSPLLPEDGDGALKLGGGLRPRQQQLRKQSEPSFACPERRHAHLVDRE